MKAKLFRQDGTVTGEIDLPDSVFAADIKEHIVYQVIKGYLANRRQGTAKTKGRSEVSGGGRKPWRQKGTGRARAGSNTSPVWVRGGKAHGPDPRDYSTRIPPALRRKALASVLSARAKEDKIKVVEGITCDPPKTKTIVALLRALAVAGQKNLLLVGAEGAPIYRAGRNVRDLAVKPFSEINAYDVAKSENIIFSNQELIGKLEEAIAS